MALFAKSPADSARPSLSDRLVSDLNAYVDTRVGLARLDVQEGVRDALVGAIQGIVLAILGLLVLVFGLLFAALALNAALHSTFWGFGIVFGCLVVLLLVFAFGVDKEAFRARIEQQLLVKMAKPTPPVAAPAKS
jgi:protein-S-isoprenylcysteine O-methyltransferase Ste14